MGEQVIYVTVGKSGVEFRSPSTWDLSSTVARIESSSAESLRRACHLLAEYIPDAGLIEFLDAAWRISEFYWLPRSKVHQALSGGRTVTQEGVLGAVRERPKVQLSEG